MRLAQPEGEVYVYIGDGTFLLNPGEIVNAVQEGLKITVVISENHGYQSIQRLQLWRHGKMFGNEFRARRNGRLEGDYIQLDLAQAAEGLGARTWHVDSPGGPARRARGPRAASRACVIVCETEPHRYLPGSDVWGTSRRPRSRASRGAARERGSTSGSVPSSSASTTRERLAAGETLVGTFLNLGSAVSAEVCARGVRLAARRPRARRRDRGGADPPLQAIAGRCAALVRVEANERPRFARALDSGADGVMVPRVDSAEDARHAVSFMRYPPAGVRGRRVDEPREGLGLGAEPAEALCVIQIETRRAVEEAREIAATDGVDVLFVGPSDLGAALGTTELPLEDVIAAAHAERKAAGIMAERARTPNASSRWASASSASAPTRSSSRRARERPPARDRRDRPGPSRRGGDPRRDRRRRLARAWPTPRRSSCAATPT